MTIPVGHSEHRTLGMSWDIGRTGRYLGQPTYYWQEEHLPLFRRHPRDPDTKDGLMAKLEWDIKWAKLWATRT